MAKDYKVGGAKKGLIIIGILISIAVIVLGIIMFYPANTYSMIEALGENEEHFFLTDDEERNDFDTFTAKVKARPELSYYVDEVNDIKNITQAMKDVLSFYNDYLIFAQNNKTLSSNTKIINKYISQTNKSQKNIDNLLLKAKGLDNDAVSYLKGSWIDFRKLFINYMENYFKMFNSLSNCYENCFENSYSKNAASKKILNAANDYLYVIVKEFKDITPKDKKDTLTVGAYSYSSHSKIECFKLFTQSYITNKSEILQYYYTPELKEKYTKLDNFFEVYNELDFKNMIKAISNDTSVGISYNYNGITDEDGILFTTAKNFLDRRA